MKVFMAPDITGDKEWKLNDFHRNETWKNLLTSEQLQELDMIPMGGTIEVNTLSGKRVKIMRII